LTTSAAIIVSITYLVTVYYIQLPPSPLVSLASSTASLPCKPSFVIVAFETVAAAAAATSFYRRTQSLASASINTSFMQRARKVSQTTLFPAIIQTSFSHALINLCPRFRLDFQFWREFTLLCGG
jgi:hypothetical protein